MKNFHAGRKMRQDHYDSFQPEPINRLWTLDNLEIIQLLGQADRELGRLDMYSEHIPNIDLFIHMHILKEAAQSNRIEGTQTKIEDALLPKEDIEPEKRNDWEEVQNYILAMNEAMQKLETLPFSARLIKETHKTLLRGVRGKHKLPGEFRRSQNWIGPSLKDAVFVPPAHHAVGELIGDLESFAHNDKCRFPELLKIALIHYQFETIHPFLDGNGRVGRLLITLYLVSKGILKRPVLYLSDFFERNRIDYYDNLMRVRDKNDLRRWFKFFLIGVIETAQNSVMTFDNILKLQKHVDGKIQALGSRAAKARKVIDYLYQRPIINATQVAEITDLSPTPAYKLIAALENAGILKEITGGKRGRTYMFSAYVALFE